MLKVRIFPNGFYTDEILESLKIPVHTPFSSGNLPDKIDYLFYSAAYTGENNPEIREALDRGLEIHAYPEALGLISKGIPTAGVAGVHGKTTTTAIAATAAQAVGLPAGAIVGSAVANFNNRSCMFFGDKALIAETCEYRRHFLNIKPQWLIVTSIEPDHLDYFKDYSDIYSAFVEYAMGMANNGTLIYCADQDGAVQLAEEIRLKRNDIALVPYGFKADGPFGITGCGVENERLAVKLRGFETRFKLRIPGRHTALNSAAAAALVVKMAEDLGHPVQKIDLSNSFELFTGSKRRSEIIGDTGGIIFMDDYAHHPTAIRVTLAGIREFYPDRRIVVDFMSHTYSRTEALLEDFAASFSDADLLILHKIYASAREKKGRVMGEDLLAAARRYHDDVLYFPEPGDSVPEIASILKPGDLFISMGAGNNWIVSHNLFDIFKEGF